MIPHNKHIWTASQIEFIKQNFDAMNSYKLSNALGITRTLVRMQCYSMGLYRMKLEYWNDEQIEYLKANYKTIGDTEIANHFNATYHKAKGWTKKHIEKKRRYLKLKRTPEEIKAIHIRNIEKGDFAMCAINAWKTRGVAPVGELRVWRHKSKRPFVAIKTETGFVHYAPYLWKQHHGDVPEGMNVTLIDNDPLNVVIENLELLSDADMARKVHKYPDELRETMELIRKIETHLKTKKYKKHATN